jgi:ADP-heptose:LPS heptosyltransferase
MRLFNPKRMRTAAQIAPLLAPAEQLLMRLLPPHPPGDGSRVLVFEPFLLGDFVMNAPAFRLLRRLLPGARIDCVGPPFLAGAERFFPALDSIIPFRCPWSPRYRDWSFSNLGASLTLARELRRRRYDWAFAPRGDFRDAWFLYVTGASRRVAFGLSGGANLLTDSVPFEGQPWSHQVEGNVLVAGYPFGITPDAEECTPEITIPEPDRAAARAWLAERQIGEFVAVHPGASLPQKQWLDSSWIELLNDAILPRYPVVLFGNADEVPLLRSLAGRLRPAARVTIAELPLAMFFSVLSLARGLVCLDSAASHIAAAVGIPVVSLLGTAPAELVRPYTPRGRAVYLTDVPCRPCFRECTQPRNFCMQDIRVASVASALHEVGVL